jgi:hypothetical protein
VRQIRSSETSGSRTMSHISFSARPVSQAGSLLLLTCRLSSSPSPFIRLQDVDRRRPPPSLHTDHKHTAGRIALYTSKEDWILRPRASLHDIRPFHKYRLRMSRYSFLVPLLVMSGSIYAQAANSIQWISPSSGAAVASGQPVEATW